MWGLPTNAAHIRAVFPFSVGTSVLAPASRRSFTIERFPVNDARAIGLVFPSFNFAFAVCGSLYIVLMCYYGNNFADFLYVIRTDRDEQSFFVALFISHSYKILDKA